jgi:ribosome-associated protein
LKSVDFAKTITDIILTKKGYDIRLLNLKSISTIADYFIICSAGSDVQVKAIADEIDKKLRDQGIKCLFKEGYESMNWILLDYFDVVVHIFREESRKFYNLEKLWGDAPVTFIEDENPDPTN